EHGGEYPKQSYGIVFRIATSGTEKVVYNFGHGCDCGNKGVGPDAPLIDVRGTLYGTTELGGADDGGVVFALRP
ncbi:MAG: choice-of-anchor tandem repeat GloVer-containing protein, partial [Candidatus Cybelea sp.]